MTQAMARSTAAGRRGPDPQGSRSRSLTEGCHVVSQAMLGPHGRQSGPAPRPVSASRVLDPRESKFGTWPTCRPARPRPPAGSRPARRPQRRWLLAVALPQPPAHPDTDHVRERQDPSVTPAVPYGLLLAWAVHDLEEVLTFERWKRTAVPRLRAGRFKPLPDQAGNTRETRAQARDGRTFPQLEREHLLEVVDRPGEQQPIGHRRPNRGILPFAHVISIWMGRRPAQGYGQAPSAPRAASWLPARSAERGGNMAAASAGRAAR